MDCHVFRRLCQELVPLVLGGRVEKVHQPASDLTMFSLYATGRKRYLFLRADRRDPFLFCANHRTPVGCEPPASVMRLRKHCGGQRLMDARILWPERRLILRVRGEDELGAWVELNLREGVKLYLGEDGAPFMAMDVEPEAAWPEAETLAALCRGDAWREWPVLSPALRRVLPLLDEGEQAALLGDLMTGGGDIFVYGLPDEDSDGGAFDVSAAAFHGCELSAWPLPEVLRAGRSEAVFESALEAVRRVGEYRVLRRLQMRAGQTAARPHVTEADRLQRLLRKLDDERERLTRMAALKHEALALQAELFRFGAEEKLDQVQLEYTAALERSENLESSGSLENPEFGQKTLRLDPRLTVRENMIVLFHRAGRGARGLAHLEERVERVRRDREQALAQAAQSGLLSERAVASPQRSSKGKEKKAGVLPKNVQAFRSSDGFLLLRGRDAKGNLALLKLAAPHDLWLHAGGGAASAHVIVRRHHAGQELPRRTLDEAGILVALKSERRGDARVDIVSALVKYVRPMRQAGRVGTVRMDRVDGTWSVAPDPELEARLGLDVAVAAASESASTTSTAKADSNRSKKNKKSFGSYGTGHGSGAR